MRPSCRGDFAPRRATRPQPPASRKVRSSTGNPPKVSPKVLSALRRSDARSRQFRRRLIHQRHARSSRPAVDRDGPKRPPLALDRQERSRARAPGNECRKRAACSARAIDSSQRPACDRAARTSPRGAVDLVLRASSRPPRARRPELSLGDHFDRRQSQRASTNTHTPATAPDADHQARANRRDRRAQFGLFHRDADRSEVLVTSMIRGARSTACPCVGCAASTPLPTAFDHPGRVVDQRTFHHCRRSPFHRRRSTSDAASPLIPDRAAAAESTAFHAT